MFPDLSAYPLTAAIVGAAFVDIGVGLVIRQGGSAGGDDALALTISKALHWKLSHAYLFTDIVVQLLSLTYIPFKRIIFSMLTATISSYLIDCVKTYKPEKESLRILK